MYLAYALRGKNDRNLAWIGSGFADSKLAYIHSRNRLLPPVSNEFRCNFGYGRNWKNTFGRSLLVHLEFLKGDIASLLNSNDDVYSRLST